MPYRCYECQSEFGEDEGLSDMSRCPNCREYSITHYREPVDLDSSKYCQPNQVIVWVFDAAPKELQELSLHFGDEDWLAIVPAGMCQPYWIDKLGHCDTSEHPLTDGATVFIGAHA